MSTSSECSSESGAASFTQTMAPSGKKKYRPPRPDQYTYSTQADFLASLNPVPIDSVQDKDRKCPHCWKMFGESDPGMDNAEKPVRFCCGHVFGERCMKEDLFALPSVVRFNLAPLSFAEGCHGLDLGRRLSEWMNQRSGAALHPRENPVEVFLELLEECRDKSRGHQVLGPVWYLRLQPIMVSRTTPHSLHLFENAIVLDLAPPDYIPSVYKSPSLFEPSGYSGPPPQLGSLNPPAPQFPHAQPPALLAEYQIYGPASQYTPEYLLSGNSSAAEIMAVAAQCPDKVLTVYSKQVPNTSFLAWSGQSHISPVHISTEITQCVPPVHLWPVQDYQYIKTLAQKLDMDGTTIENMTSQLDDKDGAAVRESKLYQTYTLAMNQLKALADKNSVSDPSGPSNPPTSDGGQLIQHSESPSLPTQDEPVQHIPLSGQVGAFATLLKRQEILRAAFKLLKDTEGIRKQKEQAKADRDKGVFVFATVARTLAEVYRDYEQYRSDSAFTAGQPPPIKKLKLAPAAAPSPIAPPTPPKPPTPKNLTIDAIQLRIFLHVGDKGTKSHEVPPPQNVYGGSADDDEQDPHELKSGTDSVISKKLLCLTRQLCGKCFKPGVSLPPWARAAPPESVYWTDNSNIPDDCPICHRVLFKKGQRFRSDSNTCPNN